MADSTCSFEVPLRQAEIRASIGVVVLLGSASRCPCSENDATTGETQRLG